MYVHTTVDGSVVHIIYLVLPECYMYNFTYISTRWCIKNVPDFCAKQNKGYSKLVRKNKLHNCVWFLTNRQIC